MKQFALIGIDVQHSLSPQLHAFFAKYYNVECCYNLEQLDADVSDQTLRNVLLRYDGCNVTMPFKKRISQMVGAQTEAVNTVLNDNGKLSAVSTDGSGLKDALKCNGVDFVGKRTLVLGCGGAGVSAVEALSGDCLITVRDRTTTKAQQVTARYGLCPEQSASYDIILSFLPVWEQLTLVSENEVMRAQVVFDAYYFRPTKLSQTAKQFNVKTVDGIDMLFFQALRSFKLWNKIYLSDAKLVWEEYLKSENISCKRT